MPGTLEVTILGAKGVRDTAWFGIQDPYVQIRLGSEECRSKTHRDGGTSPTWNEKFQLKVVQESTCSSLVLTIKNKKLMFDEFIGSADHDVTEVYDTEEDSEPQPINLPLWTKEGRRRGEICFMLKYTRSDTVTSNDDDVIQGTHAARDLPTGMTGGPLQRPSPVQIPAPVPEGNPPVFAPQPLPTVPEPTPIPTFPTLPYTSPNPVQEHYPLHAQPAPTSVFASGIEDQHVEVSYPTVVGMPPPIFKSRSNTSSGSIPAVASTACSSPVSPQGPCTSPQVVSQPSFGRVPSAQQPTYAPQQPGTVTNSAGGGGGYPTQGGGGPAPPPVPYVRSLPPCSTTTRIVTAQAESCVGSGVKTMSVPVPKPVALNHTSSLEARLKSVKAGTAAQGGAPGHSQPARLDSGHFPRISYAQQPQYQTDQGGIGGPYEDDGVV